MRFGSFFEMFLGDFHFIFQNLYSDPITTPPPRGETPSLLGEEWNILAQGRAQDTSIPEVFGVWGEAPRE